MTWVINFYGAPASGKTTCAAESFAYLKKKGFTVSLVQEYATELILEGRLEELSHQDLLFAEQLRRIRRAYGKVDFIVCDSPLLLNVVYTRFHHLTLGEKFEQLVYTENSKFNNFNILLPFVEAYHQSEGRITNITDSHIIDDILKKVLISSQESVINTDTQHIIPTLDHILEGLK